MADEVESYNKLKSLMADAEGEPSRKELLEMLESSDFDDEVKAKLRNLLLGDVPKIFGVQGSFFAIVFVLLLFAVIFFFGYKLYKSIKEKEKKREEKKKAKQMKKKK